MSNRINHRENIKMLQKIADQETVIKSLDSDFMSAKAQNRDLGIELYNSHQAFASLEVLLGAAYATIEDLEKSLKTETEDCVRFTDTVIELQAELVTANATIKDLQQKLVTSNEVIATYLAQAASESEAVLRVPSAEDDSGPSLT